MAKIGIIVGGMHRSGTSAMTRMLNICGHRISTNLIAANEYNEKGYWEDEEAVALNDRILAAIGSVWHSWAPIEEDWFQSGEALAFRAEARDFLASQFSENTSYVLKDPRISRLLPMWLGALEDLSIQPFFVHMVRHPAEVAASIHKRDGLGLATANLLWLRYHLDAEYHARPIARHFVNYTDLLADWRGALEGVAQALTQLGGNGDLAPASIADLSQEAQDEGDAFLTPSLRHHVAAAESSTEPQSAWVREAYQELRSPGRPNNPAALNKIRSLFNDAAENLFGAVRETQATVAELTQAKQELSQERLKSDEAVQRSVEATQLTQKTATALFCFLQERKLNLIAQNGVCERLNQKYQRALGALEAARQSRGDLLSMSQPIDPSLLEQRSFEYDLVAHSSFFDGKWYLARHGEEMESSQEPLLDPVAHFLAYGVSRRLSPSPFFNTEAYLTARPDVAEAGVNPLAHFLLNGLNEIATADPKVFLDLLDRYGIVLERDPMPSPQS